MSKNFKVFSDWATDLTVVHILSFLNLQDTLSMSLTCTENRLLSKKLLTEGSTSDNGHMDYVH